MTILLAIIRFILFIAFTIFIATTQLIIGALIFRNYTYIPRIFHNVSRRIFGIHYHIKGEIKRDHTVVYLANHISYLDILVLGSVLKGIFVSKSAVANWPVFGFLSKLQKTIFIKRKKSELKAAHKEILTTLRKGENIILFPEGTSTDGSEVIPFKSSLLNVVYDSAEEGHEPAIVPLVQPIAMRIARVNGKTLEEAPEFRDHYAWYGDMTMAPHLLVVAKTWRIDIEITAFPPMEPQNYESRKHLTDAAYQQVVKAVTQAP